MIGLRVHSIDGYAMSAAHLEAIKQARRATRPPPVQPVRQQQLVGKTQVINLRDVTQSPVVDELMEVAGKRIYEQFAVYDQSPNRPRVDVTT